MLQLLNLARSTPLHGQQEKLEENNIAIKNGVFDVDIDGKVVYSKHTTGRFPNQGELLMLILILRFLIGCREKRIYAFSQRTSRID